MKIKTSNLNWMLTALLFTAPAVSNGQMVSPCHSVANTSQPEFALSSAFDGTNFLIGIRGNASNPDTVGAQLLSPMGTKVGAFINTGRLTDGQRRRREEGSEEGSNQEEGSNHSLDHFWSA